MYEPIGAKRARKGGYAQSGKLIVGNAKQVSCQFDGLEAAVYTVQINSDGPIGSDSIVNVTFSVAGNTDVLRSANVGQGVSISGAADSIKVQIRDDTDPTQVPAATTPPSQNGGLGSQYNVDISCVPGNRATSQIGPTLIGTIRAKCDFFGSPDNPSGQISVPIPQNVGATCVLVQVNSEIAANPAKALVQLLNNIGAVSSYDPNVQQGFQPFLITPNEVLVTNQLAATPVYVTIVFGIDG